MRTNKEWLTDLMNEHFDSMKKDISNHMKVQIQNDDWYMARSIEVYEVVLRNIFFSAIDWTSEYEQKDIAWVRADIIEKNLAVSVGSGFYGGKEPLPYCWLNDGDVDKLDDCFQILYMGEWVDAQRCDWDFTDAVCKSPEDLAFLDGDKEDN